MHGGLYTAVLAVVNIAAATPQTLLYSIRLASSRVKMSDMNPVPVLGEQVQARILLPCAQPLIATRPLVVEIDASSVPWKAGI